MKAYCVVPEDHESSFHRDRNTEEDDGFWPNLEFATHTTEHSHREGGTEDGDWDRRAIGGKTPAVRRLLDAEHVVYRTAESNDPARLGIFLSENDMSRPLEATSGRASGITSVLLQFRASTQGAEIRAGHSDTSHAGGIDWKAADVTGDLLFGNGLCVNLQNRSRVSEFRNGTLC
jgi:hypothetical protein